MKRLAAFFVVALMGCNDAVAPASVGAVPSTLQGVYRLTSINGQSIPFDEGNQWFTTGGGLTIAVNDGWTVGDTTAGVFGATFFRWGGIVVQGQTPNAFVLKDSTQGLTRYTGTVDLAGTFTLTGSTGRAYRYQRQP